MKKCISCNVKKEIICFGKKQSRCKPCQALYQKQYNSLNKEKNKIKNKKYYEENKDNIHKKQKEYALKNKNKISEKQYREKNKEKAKKYAKQYYEKNKDQLSLKKKEYTKKNKDKIDNYKKNNQETIKIKKNKYYKENKNDISTKRAVARKQRTKEQKNREKIRDKKRYKNNKLKRLLSSAINLELRQRANNKAKEIIKHLPYTIDRLKNYIESLFEPWMSWQNWGRYNKSTWNDNDQSTWTWQIDHIIPQSLFSYDSSEHQDFKQCWSLENLRPYSAKQNQLDGASMIRHKKGKNV